MLFPPFLLLIFCFSTLRALELQCKDIVDFTEEQKTQLLENLELPLNCLKVTHMGQKNFGKSYTNLVINLKQNFVILKYNTNNNIISKQFLFHLKFLRNSWLKIFYYQSVYCFIEKNQSHLIFKEKNINEEVTRSLHSTNMDILEGTLLKMIEIGRGMENKAAFLTEEKFNTILVEKDGTIMFKTKDLAYLYPWNSEAYVDVTILSKWKNISGLRKRAVIGGSGKVYVPSFEGTRLHRFVFLRFLKNYLSLRYEYYRRSIVPDELDLFIDKIKKLLALSLPPENLIVSWRCLREFITSRGEKGELANKIRSI